MYVSLYDYCIVHVLYVDLPIVSKQSKQNIVKTHILFETEN